MNIQRMSLLLIMVFFFSSQLVSKDSDSTEDEDMMTEDEETDVRKAKVIAGEVIRSWQSRYRCKKGKSKKF